MKNGPKLCRGCGFPLLVGTSALCERCKQERRRWVHWALWTVLLGSGAALTLLEDGSMLAALEFLLEALQSVK